MRNHCGTLVLAVLIALFFFLTGCGSSTGSEPDSAKKKGAENNDIVLQINNCKISLSEFNDLIKFESYADPEMDLTADTRDQFIDYLVRKELLIQEAARLKLDSKDAFVQTIERYWEATLIRNLLDLKAVELKKEILITHGEIDAYYQKNKAHFIQPFELEKEKIKCLLESKALEIKLEKWIKSLRDSAAVKVNRTLLGEDK
jgi:SurA-like N-terminal domain